MLSCCKEGYVEFVKMLAAQDLRYSFLCFKLYSMLGILPLDGYEAGSLILTRKGSQQYLRRVAMTGSAFWALFISVRFTQVALINDDQREKDMKVLLIHGVFLVGALVMTLWNYLLLSCNGNLNAGLFNELVSRLKPGRSSNLKGQEWIIVLLPLAFMSMLGEVLVLYIFAPHYPHFFQSVLPPGAHWFWVLLVAILEVYCFTYGIATGHYGVFMQLLYLNVSRLELELGLQSLQQPGGREENRLLKAAHFGYYLRQCCEMQVRATYYNQVYSVPAYLYKLVCLFVSISGSVAGIKLVYSQPVVAGVCGYLALLVAFVYIFLYDWGFKVPQMFEIYKAVILAKQGDISRRELRILDARIKSLGSIAVRMACFHTLERCSTPMFLHFAVTTTGSIVIAFPGQA